MVTKRRRERCDSVFRKIKDIVIYQDARFYSAFPSAARLGNGKLIVCFRRAPDYRGLPGAPYRFGSHGDQLSQLYSVISEDAGNSWSEPRLVYASPEGGTQDSGLFYDSGKFLYLNSFLWKAIPRFLAEYLHKHHQVRFVYDPPTSGHLVPAGSFVMRSGDGGEHWAGPYFLDPVPGKCEVFPGFPLRPFNRANISRAEDGSLVIPQQRLNQVNHPGYRSAIMLYRSRDDGRTWQHFVDVNKNHPPGVYEEPHLHITPSGRWVLLLRVHSGATSRERRRARLWLTSSDDGGGTWGPLQTTTIHAEPSCSHRMDDGRAIVAYGYRKRPYGVRLRICDPELRNMEAANEYVVRDDARCNDVGYPWITRVGQHKYLIVYYMNIANKRGRSQIGGTVCKIH